MGPVETVNQNRLRYRRLSVGDTALIEMPYSEVCMHMHIGGEVMRVRVNEHSASLFRPSEEVTFTMPITHGEAGIFKDSDGFYTYEVTNV